MTQKGLRILLVEDDKTVRITLRDALQKAGHFVVEHGDGVSALATLEHEIFELMLTDIRLPKLNGIELFYRLRRLQPDCATLFMTAYGKIEDAVALIRQGAEDYITKPFEIDEMLFRVERIQEERMMRQSIANEEQKVASKEDPSLVVGSSPRMAHVMSLIEAAAATNVNVLITGETGTGKGVWARHLHTKSTRNSNPFVQLNCAAIPSDLFEAEMFGHEKGAFTGAIQKRKGRMLAANKGTLFLDEIGELSLEHQAKLLRAIDSGTFEPVGSSESINVDIRLISATNKDLRKQVQEKMFRQDLFFRLNVIEIAIPPLRERRNDIPLFVGDFFRRTALRCKTPIPSLSPTAMASLFSHSYPGNVRELFHALEHGLALSRGEEIDLQHLPETFHVEMDSKIISKDTPIPLSEAVQEFEQAYIRRILEQMGKSRAEVAKLLGISRKSLWQKLKNS